ncbi:5361_t:CDS:10 [Entrophospora sp. SA101]|nr:9407_t:CDS:10 [Entrophospora sp. SA101]CAJ0911360.1 5361_t:CDS:10 [Entrophospora sp. SA101]
MEYEDVLTNQPVVIDNGSGVIKAGFAGDDLPKCFISSYVGRPKHVRIMAGAVEGDVFIGRKAQELRGLLKIRYPIEHGIVSDWDDMELLLTEAPLNPRNNRDSAAQMFFETFNAPAMFTSIQAVLSLYSSGRTTGIVLDSGDGVTHAVPVYEGFALPHAIRRVDIAGRDVTEYLQLLLRKAGYNFHTTSEKEVVRIIKEKTCYVALNPSKEEKDTSREFNDFILPDGNVVKLKTERFKAPEILFNPELIGQEYAGVHQVVVDSINRADLDLRKSLFANVVLSGGSTLYKDYGTRLLNEVRKLAVKDIKIKIFAPPERKYSTWIGGSILAALKFGTVGYYPIGSDDRLVLVFARKIRIGKRYQDSDKFNESEEIKDTKSNKEADYSELFPIVGILNNPSALSCCGQHSKDGGSGKGTQSSKINDNFDITTISSGDILRQNIAHGTKIGKIAEKEIKRGAYVSDDIMIKLITNKLSTLKNENWLLDGFPRTLNQAIALDNNLKLNKQPLNMVINLHVPEEVILQRIIDRWVHIPSGRVYNLSYDPPKISGLDDVTCERLSKRPDDNPEIFKIRLQKYHELTEPLLEYYSKHNLLITCSGHTSDEIYPKIQHELINRFGTGIEENFVNNEPKDENVLDVVNLN